MIKKYKRTLAALAVLIVCCTCTLFHMQPYFNIRSKLVPLLGSARASPNTGGAAARKQPPHLVFILADDLGWNDVSWNDPTMITPYLGKLAAEGVILDRSYVLTVCTPTRSALLTSRYPFRMGRQNNIILPTAPTGLSLDVTLLPEELQKLGYETHIVGKWHLGFCKEEYTPTKRGFDHFFGYYLGAQDYYTHRRNGGYDFRNNMTVNKDAEGTYSTFAFSNHVNSLLAERNPEQPLFLYLPFQSVHAPNAVPKNYSDLYSHIDDTKKRDYKGMVTAMDEAVGKVVATLKATGHYDNSVIVFSTDNGGTRLTSNYPLRGYKVSLWEGGTRGPAFIHSPLLSAPGTVSNRTIHVTDWFPTFLHLAGGSPPDGIDGVNQWEVLNNSSLADARDYFVYDLDMTKTMKAAVRWKQYKLIVGNPGSDDWSLPPNDENKQSDNYSVNLSTLKKKHSNKEASDFVEEAIQYFNELDRQQKQGLDDDLGSTSTNKFKTLSELLNSDVELQLYDVIDDPSEREDISREYPDIVKLMLTRLINEFVRYAAKDVPRTTDQGHPRNFNSTWSSGWC